ncbi:uncharacterized protein [Battus philenor]|uniref:uncharacterized protein n=1 Tax=Battus philenor TaxID=42288 RepID=UPI0035CEE8B7
MKNNFSCKTLVTIIFTKSSVNSLIKSLHTDDCFIIRVRNYALDIYLLQTEVYIFIIQRINEFSDGIIQIIKDVLWNPRAYFIFHCNQMNSTNLKTLFMLFLKYRIYKVVLLNYTADNKSELYTYYPFERNNCGQHFDKVVKLGNCDDIDTIYVFLNNEQQSLRNCSVKVAAKEDIPNVIFRSSNFTVFGYYVSGLEQYMLENIAAIENITIDYECAYDDISYGVVLPNRSSTGVLGRLENGEVSIAIGGYVLIKNRIEVFDYIWGYGYTDFVLLTPAIGEHVWRKVYREFGLKTWLLIILAYTLMTSFTVISQYILSKKRMNTFTICMKLWAYFYGFSDERLIRNTRPRSLIVLWSMFTFFIHSFYNTAYYSIITGHVKELRTVDTDEINSLPLKPCISDPIRTIFEYAFNFSLPEGNGNPECKFTESAMTTVASRNNMYAIEMSNSYKLRQYKYIDKDGNHLMDSWDFLYDTIMSIYIVRGFPLKDKFQNYALYMYESGLLQRHLKIISIKNLNSMRRFNQDYKRIGIADLRVPFALLLAGTLMSLVCFIIERLKCIIISNINDKIKDNY